MEITESIRRSCIKCFYNTFNSINETVSQVNRDYPETETGPMYRLGLLLDRVGAYCVVSKSVWNLELDAMMITILEEFEKFTDISLIKLNFDIYRYKEGKLDCAEMLKRLKSKYHDDMIMPYILFYKQFIKINMNQNFLGMSDDTLQKLQDKV